MNRTTIMLPTKLKRRAEAAAKRRKQSLGSYIRESLERSLRQDVAGPDPLLDDTFVVDDDGPTDLAENHDHYLEQMLLEEHESGGRPAKPPRRG